MQRLEVALLMQTNEEAAAADAQLQTMLQSVPISLLPNNALLVCHASLLRQISALKKCSSADSLPRDAETVKGSVEAWSLITQGLSNALTEATKSIKECIKREKKKEKEEQAKRKREEAKAKREQDQAEAAEAAEGKRGRGSHGAMAAALFVATLKVCPELTPLKVDDFLKDGCVDAPSHHIMTVMTPEKYADDDSFASRKVMFADQFQSSQACVSNDRIFMKLGGGAEKLLKNHETWVKNTKPVATAGDSENAKIFVPGFVGIKKDQTSLLWWKHVLSGVASLARWKCARSPERVWVASASLMSLMQVSYFNGGAWLVIACFGIQGYEGAQGYRCSGKKGPPPCG